MSRSVSIHPRAVATVYLHPEVTDEHDWEILLEQIVYALRKKYQSLHRCNRWASREDHVILESKMAEVSVSEYCGLVAVCLAPCDLRHSRYGENGLGETWSRRAATGFVAHLHRYFPETSLRSIGRFSNGEQAFAPINRVGGLVTSKEATLW